MASITIDGIVKQFSGQTVLQNLSLHIPDGAFYTLLGPSGCGKTTLLRCIAGFYEPDGGRLLFDQDDVTRVSTHHRDIGMVFQDYALFPDKSAFDNVAYGLRARKVARPEIARRVGEALEKVGLSALAERYPAQMSGGQRQRVALARAVAVRPRVLLLDEPLTALDAKLKEALRDELAELLRRLHITAIHVTHDQQEALAIADRLAVMQAGRIVQVGDGETLYRAPAHSFVATFLGRVNSLQRGEAARARQLLPLGGIEMPCPAACAADTVLLVRPEDIEVQAGPAGEGWGRAEVLRRSFLGERVQLTLAVAGQEPLQADVARDHPARQGEGVAIRIRPERLMPSHQST